MRILILAVSLVAALMLASPAVATTNPQAKVTLKCEMHGGAHVHATFIYSGFSPRNNLTATQTLHVGHSEVTTIARFNGPGGTFGMNARLPDHAAVTVHAMSVVRGGAGRIKAEAEATVTCRQPPHKPPDTTPPPPDRPTIRPRAHFWGPCGDPFYRAVLDNRRSERAVKFRVNYKPYGDPRRTLVRTVRRGKILRTGLFDVAGRTRMTIRGGDRLLDSQLSAPNRVYKPCPTGVPVIG